MSKSKQKPIIEIFQNQKRERGGVGEQRRWLAGGDEGGFGAWRRMRLRRVLRWCLEIQAAALAQRRGDGARVFPCRLIYLDRHIFLCFF